MISLSELEQSYALSAEAGWNQTTNDWRRIRMLAGEARFGITAGGTLVATTVAIRYSERLAWIGMVLTAVEHRGKGFARTLTRQALDHLDREGVACVKLDATEMGRPVYARLGFVDERPVTRWRREPGARVAPAPALEVQTEWSDSLLALDLEMFGVDRSPLLRLLAEDEIYVVPGAGFAFARPGRTAWHFGPCVSRDAQTARALLAAFLAQHSDEPSFLDACDDHPDAVSMAGEADYRPARCLMRMLRGDASGARLASGPGIYALAGFEFG